MEDHARLDAHRSLEEPAVVTDPRAVVDMVGGRVELFAGIERFADIGVPERLEVFTQIEVVFEFHAPFGHDEVDLGALLLFPSRLDAARPLGCEQKARLDVEVEVGVELPARIGIDQQVVRHVLVADLSGEMEHREGVAEVEPLVERVAARRDDAEHFARLLGVHALPVDGHFHIGVPAFRGFVVPQKTRKAVVVERRRIPEERQRVVAQQLFAVEDSGVGLHVPAVELIVGRGARLAQEFGVVAEVLQEVHADDQPVFVHPFHADPGCEPGAEERLRFVEIVVGVLPVVETGRKVGADDQLLRLETSPRNEESERECQDFFQRHSVVLIRTPKIGKIFFI